MKPTEAKKWIQKLVSTGMGRESATTFVNEVTAIPEEVANGVLWMVYGARVASIAEPVKPKPEVEIPRRVMYIKENVPEWTGMVADVQGETPGFFKVNFGHTVGAWRKTNVVELRLTKTEQARLLLERLSKEAWKEREGLVLGDPNCYIINLAGEAKSTPHEQCDPYAIRFPDEDSVSHARDAIIHAGLAWWKEGE